MMTMSYRFVLTASLLGTALLGMPGRGAAQQVTIAAEPAPAFNALFRKTSGWVAGDGAFSVPLADGRVLWLFGDSHIGGIDSTHAGSGPSVHPHIPPSARYTVPCLFQVRNAAFVHRRQDMHGHQTLIGKPPGIPSLFKVLPGDSTWVWPGFGVQLGDTVYIMQSEFRATGSGGPLGFEATGRYYLSRMTFPGLTVAGYQLLADANGINFSIGMVRPEGDNYVYLYGYKTALVEPDIYVARIPARRPWSAWEYWDGAAWQPDVQRASAIGKGASNGVNVQQVDGRYLLVSTEFSIDCDQGKQIFVSLADRPQGPFGKRMPVYVIPDTLQGHYPFFYAPAVHPEFRKDSAVLVTYCINEYGHCVTTCVNNRKNPDHYRPRAFWLSIKDMEHPAP